MRTVASAASVVRAVLGDRSNEGHKTARLLAAVGWQLYKRVVGQPIILRLDNEMLYWADPRSGNASSVVYNRIYEGRFVQFVRQHVPRGGRLVDVGAHTGLFTLLVAPLFDEADCFEPAPDCFQILEQNLTINALTRFRGHRIALSDVDAEGHLDASAPLSGIAALLQADERDERPTHVVQCRRLDALELLSPGELSFMKIDTEGHEAEVLDGSVDTLACNPGALVMAENTPSLREWLRTTGTTLTWRHFALDEEDRPTTHPDEITRAHNLFACGPAHQLWRTVG